MTSARTQRIGLALVLASLWACNRDVTRRVPALAAPCPDAGLEPCRCEDGSPGVRACGGDDEDGACWCTEPSEQTPAGCTLERVDGSTLLRCPDGTQAELPERFPGRADQCALEWVDGGQLLRCPDAEVVLPGAELDSPADGGADATDLQGPVLEGSILIESALDVARFAAYAEVTGDLVVRSRGLTEVLLPRLVRVGGDVQVVEVIDLKTLRLPKLREVGRLVTVSSNTRLQRVELPALDSVGQSLSCAGNRALALLQLDNLRRVGGSMYLANNVLASLSLPALAQVTDLTILEAVPATSTVALTSIAEIGTAVLAGGRFALPALTRLKNLVIACGEVQLASELSVERLAIDSRAGSCAVSAERVVHADQLTVSGRANVSLPQLRDVGHLDVREVGTIDTIKLPALSQVKTLRVHGRITRFACAGLLPAVAPDAYPGFGVDDVESLTTFDCAQVQRVTGGLSLSFSKLERLEMPALVSVAGDLTLGGVTIAHLDALLQLDGALRTAPELRELSLRGLGIAPHQVHYGVAALSTEEQHAAFVAAGYRAITGGLRVSYAALSRLSLPALERVGNGVWIGDNADLRGVHLPALRSVGYGIEVTRNPVLIEVALPALRRTGTVRLCGDRRLPRCYAQALAAQTGVGVTCNEPDHWDPVESQCDADCCPGVLP